MTFSGILCLNQTLRTVASLFVLHVTHKSTYPRHELDKNGEFLLFKVPKTTIVLNNPLVTQILQQLNLTLQSIHLLQKKGFESRKTNTAIQMHSIKIIVSYALKYMQSVTYYVLSHLAGFVTVCVKGHLLGGQLAACVGVITEVDLPESPAPQELSLPPVDWRPRCCRNTTPDDENPQVIHFVTKPPETDRSTVIY